MIWKWNLGSKNQVDSRHDLRATYPCGGEGVTATTGALVVVGTGTAPGACVVVNSIAGIVVVLPTIAGLGVVATGTAAGLEGVVVIAVKWMYI